MMIALSGCHSTNNGDPFQHFIKNLEQEPVSGKELLISKFLDSIPHTPIVSSDSVVHFIYHGKAETVMLAGDVTYWQPAHPFTNVAGTDFWYFSTTYEPDARLDYKLVIDSTQWILDPLNPDTCFGGYGPNSELRMPQCQVVPAEVKYYPYISHGQLIDTVVNSVHLGDSRNIKVYLPHGYSALNRAYPIILFHDGEDYLRIGQVINTLDYLIHYRQIEPIVAVFTNPAMREEEFAGSKKDQYAHFITTELLPFIQTRYVIDPDPMKHAMIGVSNGGNISLYISVMYPDIFGLCGSQSGNVIPEITKKLEERKTHHQKFYIDIGKYDIEALVPMAWNLKEVLPAKGYDLQFYQWNEGHSWGNWKEHLRYPLKFFFPYSSKIQLHEKPE
jgi:enterochelin esterase family protein